MFDCVPVHNPLHNCVEDIYSTVLSRYELDYSYMYLDYWNFGFNINHKDLIGHALYSNREEKWRNEKQDEYIAEYLGVNIKWEEYTDFESFLEKVQENLRNNTPVGVYLDTFHCPWHKAFQKYYITHYILLIGTYEGGYICVDPFTTNEFKKVSLDYLKLVLSSFSIFRFDINENRNKKINIDSFLVECARKSLNKIDGYDDFERMEQFATCIVKPGALYNEFKDFKDVAMAPLTRKLDHISSGRKKMMLFLDKILSEENNEKHMWIVKEFESSSNKWEIIKSFIIKEYFLGTKSKNLNKIYDRIIEVAELEKRLAYRLLNEKNI